MTPILQEPGWTPEPVWTGAENVASTVIRSQDLSSTAASLYIEYATRPSERESHVILILDTLGNHKSLRAFKFFHANEI